MATTHVKGADKLQKQLLALGREAERAVLGAVRDTAFAARDEIAKDIAEHLNFRGPATEKFIAGGFRVRYGQAGNIARAVIYPLQRTLDFIRKHAAQQTTLTAQNADQNLEIDGRIAIPVSVKRGSRGRVSAAQSPERLVGPGGGGFISRSGKALLRRTGKALEVAYVLVDRAQFRKRLDPQEIARKVADREFEKRLRSKILQAWGRVLGKAMR